MIEKNIDRIATALERIADALEGQGTLNLAAAAETATEEKDVNPPAEETKALKKRATKKAKTAPEEPAKTDTPEPAAETTPEPEPATTGLTVDDVAQMVRDCYATAGDDKQAKKDAYNALRAEFGIEKLSELAGDKRLPEFAKRVQAL